MKMKVYVSLNMYEGLPTADPEVFATKEGAEKEFLAWMAENGHRELGLEIMRKENREDLVPSDLAGSGIYEAEIGSGKVLVEVSGGLVSAVYADREGIRVVVNDYDNEAEDPEWVNEWKPIIDSAKIEEAFKDPEGEDR